MTKMAKKCSRNVQLIRGSFGKEIPRRNTTYKIHTLESGIDVGQEISIGPG
jgi:hypothetical protein